jgi:hypothetical protein
MIQGSGSFARRLRVTVVVSVLLVFGLALAWTYLAPSDQGTSYAYSAMLADARAGKVESISQDELRLAVSVRREAQPKTVFVASSSINVYAEVCAATGKAPGPDCPIQFEVVGESQSGQWLGLMITAFLPVLLIGAFIFFMMRAQQQKK